MKPIYGYISGFWVDTAKMLITDISKVASQFHNQAHLGFKSLAPQQIVLGRHKCFCSFTAMMQKYYQAPVLGY